MTTTTSPLICPRPLATPDVWARLHARDHVTRYRRRGAGSPLLVLAGPAGARGAAWPVWIDALAHAFADERVDALVDALVEGLAREFRLVLPHMADAPPDVTGWLCDLVDGLGLPSVDVLAAGPHCATALAFALGGAGRVRRLVLVAPGVDDGPESAAAPPPLLVVPADATAAVLPAVAAFLNSGPV